MGQEASLGGLLSGEVTWLDLSRTDRDLPQSSGRTEGAAGLCFPPTPTQSWDTGSTLLGSPHVGLPPGSVGAGVSSALDPTGCLWPEGPSLTDLHTDSLSLEQEHKRSPQHSSCNFHLAFSLGQALY